jgi:hypothetical protein
MAIGDIIKDSNGVPIAVQIGNNLNNVCTGLEWKDGNTVQIGAHTHHISEVIGNNNPTWNDFERFKKEMREEMQYMKDFLIYKEVMIDENEFKEFVESRQVAQKLYKAGKPKEKFNIDMLDGAYLTNYSFSSNNHMTSQPITFTHQPFLSPMCDEKEEDK